MSELPLVLTRFRVEVDEVARVGEVVLNRGDQLNVMDPTFFEELGAALQSLDESDQVNVVLMWAEGRVFTAGLDMKAMGSLMDPSEWCAPARTPERSL